jgi:hypothetical protein
VKTGMHEINQAIMFLKNIMGDDPALVKIIGRDWRKVKVATWIKRLKDKGYISKNLLI